MEQGHDELFYKRLDFIEQLSEKHQKKELEDFFGVMIKVADRKKGLYNVYIDGNLFFTNMHIWDIEEAFNVVSHRLVAKLYSNCEKESDLEKDNSNSAELEAKKLDGYFICPTCNFLVRKGTHFHF